MILSLFVYTLTAIILYNLSMTMSRASQYGKCTINRNSQIAFIGILATFGFIVGARYDVGVDHLAYLYSYEYSNSIGIRDDMEEGFAFITKWMYNAGFHYFFYFALWGILQIGFLYQTLKYKKQLLPYIGLLIMLGPYFLNWMNGIRQTTVACFFVFLISTVVVKKQLILYIFLIYIASKIHNSALLLIPFIFLGYYNIEIKNKWISILVLLACTILGSMPFWTQYLLDLQNILELIGYGDRYGSKFEEMLTGDNFSSFAWGPMRISDYVIDLIILWFYPKMRIYFKDDTRLPIFFLLYFIGVCSYNLFAGTNQIFLRVVIYFTIFKLPMTAYLLYYLRKSRLFFFYITSIIAYMYIYIVVIKASLPSAINTYQHCNLYKFFFFES